MPMRELHDEKGHTWQVWEVHPGGLGVGGDETRHVRVRDAMSRGWLAFACVETGLRFRVAPPPTAWHELPDGALLQIGRGGEPVVFQPLPPRDAAAGSSGEPRPPG